MQPTPSLEPTQLLLLLLPQWGSVIVDAEIKVSSFENVAIVLAKRFDLHEFRLLFCLVSSSQETGSRMAWGTADLQGQRHGGGGATGLAGEG